MQVLRVSVVEFAARNTGLQAGTATCAHCTSLDLACALVVLYGAPSPKGHKDRPVQSLP